MTRRERLLLVVSVWLCVFPGVTLFSYVFAWLEFGWPVWVEIALSTACTVPLISLLIVPRVERLIAMARHESLAELKVEQARAADGPDPEAMLHRGRARSGRPD